MATDIQRLLLLGLIAGALACGAGPDEPAEPAGGEAPARAEEDGGAKAPDFTLPLLGGGEVTLSDLRGTTVLIDFWATWCPPCEFQIPILNEVYREYRDRDVEILGVSVDTAGPEAVEEYLEEHEAVYPIVLGSESLARRFGAMGFPALAVVTPDGRISRIHVGLVEAEELETMIAAVSGESGDGDAAGASDAAPDDPAGQPAAGSPAPPQG